MGKSWKDNYIAGGIFSILRIWLGVQWITSSWGKITGGFDASGFLQGAIAQASGDHPAVQGWYAAFLEGFALPNVELFNVLVPWGEFLVGLGLVLGAATIPALLAGALMNLNFLLAGTVSVNPIYYTIAMILLFAGRASYCFGVDRFMIPFLKNRMGKEKKTNTIDKKIAA